MSVKLKCSLLFIYSLLIISFAACTSDHKQASEEELRKQAQELAQKYIITDGHIDVPYRLNAKMEDVSVRTQQGEFDYVRARAGGLDAPFMSIYVDAVYQAKGGAKAAADSLIDLVENIAKKSPDKFALAYSVADVEKNTQAGKISLPMGMENGAPIESKIENVDHFYKRGIRYITLAHSKDNFICDSATDTTHTWNGVSPLGEQIIGRMNQVGIMVDVSHISDSSFYDVMRLTKAPVIASHSSCRHFTPDQTRNMTDDMIRKLAANKGVIQICFGTYFLNNESIKNDNYIKKWLKENNIQRTDSTAVAYIKQFNEAHTVTSDISQVADHIDHVVKLVGIEYVGIGSDFDGVEGKLAKGLEDVSKYPNLIYELLKRGYSEEDIRKICYTNVFRVWSEVERIAKEQGTSKVGS
ncbi:membrane dipeptidase [Rhodocytophaga rosea]|uniref:Membrane dipeptidase n=1 Tax=Rhodocytophaga rosea TaxID=2704465 RepID=A0A6C0GIS9_9BACT|nr:dipeptidase [Rhodocytophaga rosea]QHT67562.1 membrane dipeptidase [Rhodocytophaga rosea]